MRLIGRHLPLSISAYRAFLSSVRVAEKGLAPAESRAIAIITTETNCEVESAVVAEQDFCPLARGLAISAVVCCKVS